jgi:hypothetical protein
MATSLPRAGESFRDVKKGALTSWSPWLMPIYWMEKPTVRWLTAFGGVWIFLGII